jgi:hypothetical protein
MSPSQPRKPTQLQLTPNDLDFYYLPERASAVPTRHADVLCTVDCSRLFANGGHHMVFALDCTGGQGSYNPHCGPIFRRRDNLWSEARGFIIFADGTVMAERWNGTAMPVLATVANTADAVFDPAVHPIFTVRIQAGYRAGSLADRMRVTIHQGITVDGPVLFQGEVAGAGWGWDRSGVHKVAIAAIAAGFVPPSATDCVEEVLPRSAPNAVLPFVGFKLRLPAG